MADDALSQARERMIKSVEATARELGHIRTSKATPSLLDGIKVDYFTNMVPISQAATISVPEPRMIIIQPWEKKMIPEIVKEIMKSDLGLNPIAEGNVIRLPIPPLNEERRRELVKHVKNLVEDGRVAIRNIRRDANEQLKKAEKAKEISEDDHHRTAEKVQELTDKFIGQLDEMLEAKEEEIMEV
ncbi:ribosome recycling factor [Candidatus Zixiibacteriota bacterium]